MSNSIYIFDTSPGCSMTVPEKLRRASKLADLGVDIMEAGFPTRTRKRKQARSGPLRMTRVLRRSATTCAAIV